MAIDPTALKALIDTQITNETVNFAITPQEVGGRIKDAIDYTTEQIAGIGSSQSGPQGPQGFRGFQGFQGLQGPSGTSGTGTQGPQGLAGAQGFQGLAGFQGPTGTAPVATSGFISATSSFPYTLLSNTINQVTSTSNFPLQRVQLPVSTSNIGDRVTFMNAGNYMISVSANLVGGSIYYNGISGTPVSELITYPNQRYDFTYLGSASWLCAAVQSKLLLEYSAPLFQTGTDDPVPQSEVIDTLSVGLSWTGDDFRSVEFTRVTTGKYKLWVKWKNVNTNSSNLGVMFGDGICVTDGVRSNGTDVSGVSYSSWEFSTYTPGGTASDGLLKGTNAACFSVKLYQ